MHGANMPRQIYGGIIADPMGLGKTLTMIALVASDLDSQTPMPVDDDLDQTVLPSIPATLVIVPPPCEYSCTISCQN